MTRSPAASFAVSCRAGLLPVVLPLLFLGSGAAVVAAEEETGKGDEKTVDLWGKLGGKVRDTEDFHELTRLRKDDRGRLRPEKVVVKIAEDVPLLADRAVRVTDLEEGQVVWILGREVIRDVPSRRGGIGVSRGQDRQIQNAYIAITGEKVKVNEKFKDPRDPNVKWYRTTVKKSGGGLWVTYQGGEYRVTLRSGAPVIHRKECKERKLLRRSAYVQVVGEKTEPPEGAKVDEPAYRAKRMVLLDRRFLTTAYVGILR